MDRDMSLTRFVHDANTIGVIGKLDEGRDEEHAAAWRNPRSCFERSGRAFLEGLANYAEGYERLFQEPLGTHPGIGGPWQATARAVLELLEDDTGRLNPGVLGACVRELAMRAGFIGADLW